MRFDDPYFFVEFRSDHRCIRAYAGGLLLEMSGGDHLLLHLRLHDTLLELVGELDYHKLQPPTVSIHWLQCTVNQSLHLLADLVALLPELMGVIVGGGLDKHITDSAREHQV